MPIPLSFNNSLLDTIHSLPESASAALAQTDSGFYPSFATRAGTSIRHEKAVMDIGTTLMYSLFRHLSETNVAVPATISIAFDSQFSPANIGVMQTPAYTRLRAAVIAEAIRRKLTNSSGKSAGDIAQLAQQYGLPAADMQAMIQRTIDKLDTIFTTSQSTTLLTTLTSDSAAAALNAYLSIPDVSREDIEKAYLTLTQLHADLVSNVDLPVVFMGLQSAVTDIKCFNAIRSLVQMKIYYGLPTVPMSVQALLSLIETSDATNPEVLASLPKLSRVTSADPDSNTPGQFKFWQLDCQGLVDQVSIADVITTLSSIDQTLFGLRATTIPVETYLAYTLQQANASFVPMVPAIGKDLLSEPSFAGLRSVTAMIAAMTQNSSSFLTQIKTSLAGYKPDGANQVSRPDIILIAETLAAIADVMPKIRTTLVDILHASDKLSFLYDVEDNDSAASFTIDLLTQSGSVIGSGSSKSKNRKKKEATAADMYGAGMDLPKQKLILSREVMSRWMTLHFAALEPLLQMPSDPSTVRALLDASSITSRPPAVPLRMDLQYFLAVDNWYSRTAGPDGGSLMAATIPIPFIQGDKRVYASISRHRGYADMSSAAMARSLFPIGVNHSVVPFFTIPNAVVGVFDLSGLTGIFPIGAAARISNRNGDPIAQAMSGLVSEWGTGYVDLGISRVQTAILLRNASVLAMSTKGDVMQSWSDLYRLYNVPVAQQLDGSLDVESAAFSDMAITLQADPVIFIKANMPLRVERSGLIGSRFSLGAPSFATHQFEHSVLSSTDADILLNPASSIERGVDEPLFVNHASSKVMLDHNASKPEQKGQLDTNVGLKQVNVATPAAAMAPNTSADDTTTDA